jgi:glycosyltransferase involved in cell wall biosynthesis
VLFVGARFKGKGGLDVVAALGPELGTKFELDVVSQEQPPPSPAIRCHQLAPGDPRLIELYQQADVFCMPSYADSAGFSVVEAMACQLPVVGSTVGGMPDVIGDAGIVVRPGDRSELRAVLHRLADDRGLRERLGRQARSRAEQSLNATVQTAKLIELMKAAVS